MSGLTVRPAQIGSQGPSFAATRTFSPLAAACVAALLTFSLAGCKSSGPAVSDDALAGSVKTTLSGDSAIAGQTVQTSVQGGVVTLTGTVENDAQRSLAARDAAGIAGVKQVVNQISVGPPASTTAVAAPLPPPPTVTKQTNEILRPEPAPRQPVNHQPAPIERRNEAAYEPPPPPPQPQPQPAPAPPPPPAQPTFRNVTISAGSSIPVRITQTLDSATTQEGTSFSGVVNADIVIDGVVAIPQGSNVSGTVDTVHEAGHFKGSSLLTVSLNGITRRGEKIAVQTDPYSVQGKGRGVNTAEKAGGGAAVGAILGGIFGGGKGAAIGAAAGGGVGAGANAVTRGQQVQIASESVVRFHLTNPITIRVRTDGGDHGPQRESLPR